MPFQLLIPLFATTIPVYHNFYSDATIKYRITRYKTTWKIPTPILAFIPEITTDNPVKRIASFILFDIFSIFRIPRFMKKSLCYVIDFA